MKALDVETLLARARSADQAAWAEIVRRFGPIVLKAGRTVGLNAADQEEAFQETWVALYSQIELLQSAAALPRWIAVTAFNRAVKLIDQRERRRDRETLAAEDGADETEPSSESLALQAERQALVQRAIARLPSPYRLVLEELYFSEADNSYEAVAKRMRVARGSIGPTRLRGLALLADRLQSEFGADETPLSD